MSFTKPTGGGNILIFIQINRNISEEMDTKVFDISYNCDLEWKSRSFKLISYVMLSGPYHRTKFEINWSVNIRLQAKDKGFYSTN